VRYNPFDGSDPGQIATHERVGNRSHAGAARA
jgi:hypothetical protein